MMTYLSCIKKVKGVNENECRMLAKSYLACRMDRWVTTLLGRIPLRGPWPGKLTGGIPAISWQGTTSRTWASKTTRRPSRAKAARRRLKESSGGNFGRDSPTPARGPEVTCGSSLGNHHMRMRVDGASSSTPAPPTYPVAGSSSRRQCRGCCRTSAAVFVSNRAFFVPGPSRQPT